MRQERERCPHLPLAHTTVCKQFVVDSAGDNWGWFRGQVVSTRYYDDHYDDDDDDNTEQLMYKIVYDDGDCEEMTHAEVEDVLSLTRRNRRCHCDETREKVVVAVPLLLWSGPPDEPAKTCATFHADDSDNNDAESLAHKSKGGSDDSEVSSVASSSQEEDRVDSIRVIQYPAINLKGRLVGKGL